MIKTLSTVQRVPFLSKHCTTRHFRYYCNNGEYKYLDRFNYVGNHGIYWTHPQSSFVIRVTDDYDQCRLGNQSKGDKTCWWYFPKKILSMMENDFSEQDVCDIESELRSWKLIQTAPKKYFEWSASLARCYSAFPQAPREQKVFGAKQYAATFRIDDSVEQLNSDREYNSAAEELLKNLGLIFRGKFDQVTDMNKFKGRDNIPDSYIEKATRAIEIQKDVMKLGKQLLKPKIYDLYVLSCHHYLNGVTAEKILFQKHCLSKTVISEQEGSIARHRSIGLRWILPTMMTNENTAVHLNLQNPAVDLASLIMVLENDLIGCFKDRYVDFSPMTYFQSNSSAKSDLDAARFLANRVNKMKKIFVYLWENVPVENAEHYEYLAKFVGSVSDYSFVTRLRHNNDRYGWIPQKD